MLRRDFLGGAIGALAGLIGWPNREAKPVEKPCPFKPDVTHLNNGWTRTVNVKAGVFIPEGAAVCIGLDGMAYPASMWDDYARAHGPELSHKIEMPHPQSMVCVTYTNA